MKFDLIIIGAGPAGLTAAIFARRFKLNTLVISKDIGGTVNMADIIENYPAIKSITGRELAKLFYEHAKKYDVKIIEEFVLDIKNTGNEFEVITENNRFYSKAIIIATGERHRKLNLPKEESLKGISYCAVCDAPLFKDKVVAVVGGGNTAVAYAKILSQHAKKIYLIHRRREFRADPIEIESIKNDEKIEFVVPYIIKELKGEEKISGVILEEVDEKLMPTGKTIELKIDGLFIAIGLEPNSELAAKIGVKLSESGHIIVDDDMKTNVKGVFAAGDVTDKGSKMRLIITAAAQGAIAAFGAFKYIKSGVW